MRNDDSSDLHVDGYHRTLFQVELPRWLPLDIVVKMTARFEEILRSQIRSLMKSNKRHPITPSGQSGEVLSSDSSDGEDDAIGSVGYGYGDVDLHDSESE
jgi:hypothetical protein